MSNGTLLLGWRKRWNRSLLRFLGRRVRASVDIEDLAQETYLRLLRAHDLGSVLNPQAYLLKVASHVVAEWHDRQLPPEKCEAVDEDLLADEAVPEFALEAEIWQALLDQALKEMSPLTRAVLLLRFRENRRCSDIARELQLTDRQVRRHLTRGYERLRSTLMI
jgi:RNA polymerase sigma-70 factor (ECF subfamily)